MRKRLFIFFFCICLFMPCVSVLAFDVDSSAVVTKITNLSLDGTSYKDKGDSVTTKEILFVVPMDEINYSDFFIRVTSGCPVSGCPLLNIGYVNDIPVSGTVLDKSLSPDSAYKYPIRINSAGDYDLTDLCKHYYDSDYKYLLLNFRPDPYKKNNKYYYTQGNYVNMYSQSNYVPTPAPTATPTPRPTATPVPTSAPVPSSDPDPSVPPEDLSDFDWKMIMYELFVSEGYQSTLPMRTYFVPYNVTNLEQDIQSNQFDVFGQVFSYRVKIPFRFECQGFDGIGNFDTHIKFDADVSSPYIPTESTSDMDVTWNFSTPWIESLDDGFSFDATAPGGGYPTGIDLHNASVFGSNSPEYYYCFDVYVSIRANHTFLGFGNAIKVELSNIRFDITDSQVESSRLPSEVLEDINKGVGDINDTIKEEHQEEIDKADEAVNEVTGGVEQITGVLNSWEIVTMPVKLVGDFVQAITSDGSTGLTFPSFQIMGQTLWPDYTFDLKVIAEKFPVLYNALHIISGILVVIGFLRYCWRKWHVLTGDDLPEGESK